MGLFTAEIAVWSKGYVWQEVDGRRCLEPRGPFADGSFRRYDPFAESPLAFDELAQLGRGVDERDDSEERVADFANRRGLLWGQGQPHRPGLSTFDNWSAEAKLLAGAVRLWESDDGDKANQLSQLLARRPGLALTHAVDMKPDGSLVVGLHVAELVQVLWAQFTLWAAGHVQARRCRQCHRLFEIRPGMRSDRLYCSRRCNNAAYERRQLDATGIKSETDVGKSPRGK